MKIIVAATEFCRRDLSHEFKLVWIRATNRSDEISASSLVAACARICNKSLRQNLMREHQLVSHHVKFELIYISSLPKSIACTEQVSYRSDLSQHQCRREDSLPRCVAAICRIVCLRLYRPRVKEYDTWPDTLLPEQQILLGRGGGWARAGKGYYSKFYKGRLFPEVWPLTLLYTT